MSLHDELQTGRPKRKCSVQPIVEDEGEDEVVSRKLRTSSPAPKAKPHLVSTPLRIIIPDEEDCKLSDNLADSCRTLCKICGSAYTLTNMRSHTMKQHDLQITKYKDLYGPFEIIEKVFHKCHLCGKILLLDSDAMGGHIKGTHKMKEKVYKERFMTNYSYGKADSKTSSTASQKKFKLSSEQSTSKEGSKIDSVDSKENSKPSISKPQYDFKTTFPDFEYSCNLKHCELCEHGGVNVLLETLANSEVRDELNEIETPQNQDTSVLSVGSELVTVEESCSVGQGGWSKKFLPTDILVGGEFDKDEDKNEHDHDENFNDTSFDYSDESFLEESMDSPSDTSEDDTDEN